MVDFLIMAQYRYSLEAVVVRTHAADETGRSMLWREWGVFCSFENDCERKTFLEESDEPVLESWTEKSRLKQEIAYLENKIIHDKILKNFVKNDLY